MKMSKKTRQALLKSIGNWEAIVEGTMGSSGPITCPLCTLFNHAFCQGCPVYNHSEQLYCRDTPYVPWVRFFEERYVDLPYSLDLLKEGEERDEGKRLAQDELDFLRSLLD